MRAAALPSGDLVIERARLSGKGSRGALEAGLGFVCAGDIAGADETLLIPRLCAGDPGAGPIAQLEPAERFHWIVAPSSTVVQPSDVHTGITGDPEIASVAKSAAARTLSAAPPGEPNERRARRA